MKDAIGGLISFLLFIAFILVILFVVGDTVNDYRENLGKAIVIELDTMTVTSFNILTHDYYLSNGATVDEKYAKDKILPSVEERQSKK